MEKKIETIIFDLGAVLIDWNPDYLFKKIISEEHERNWFYENICTPAWNDEQDAGRPLQEATDELIKQYPAQESSIRAYYGRWEEMLNGPIEGTLEIFRELKEIEKYNFFALTNWSAETFHIALDRYEFLHWFDGILVSGEEKTRKPFPDFYKKLITKYFVDPAKAVYIDDNYRNLFPAQELGMHTIHFSTPEHLRQSLNNLGIL